MILLSEELSPASIFFVSDTIAGERPYLRFPPNVEDMINNIPDGHSFFQTSPNSYFKTSSHIVVQKETETISKKGKGLKQMTEKNTEPLSEGGPVDKEPKKKKNVIQKEPDSNKKKGTEIQSLNRGLLAKQFSHMETGSSSTKKGKGLQQMREQNTEPFPEGSVEPATPVKKEPYDLPPTHNWVICNLFSDSMYTEVYNLLKEHFSNTDVGKCDYSQKYLTWALHPPGYYRDWQIGVREKQSRRLVGFISAVPARIRVCDKVVKMAEIKLLCLERSLRKQNFATVMINELTRRVHLKDIWQAVYAADKNHHTPITSSQYWLFPLNFEKAVAIGAIGEKSLRNPNKQLPDATVTPGFRKMEKGDVPTVTRLLRTYLNQFKVAPDFDKNDVKHWFVPQEDVVYSYVVVSPDSHTVTDFCSFYTNHHTIPNYETFKSACSYYTFATHTSIQKLMKDALIVSKQQGFDIFTVCDVMKSYSYLKELRFIKGEYPIHYYLHNYRLPELKPSEIGLVLTAFE